MDSDDNIQVNEYEKVFNFLDKNKKKKISADDVILGLGALGKICTLEEKAQIESDSNYYDLESFINICQEKVDLNNIEMNLRNFLYSFQSKKKPGYIKRDKIFYILKKYDFERNIKEKKINELIKEVSQNNNENYISIKTLVNEFLSS